MEKKRNRHQSPKKIASHTFRLVTESALTPQRALRENQPGAGRPHTLQTGVPSFQGPAVPGGGAGSRAFPPPNACVSFSREEKAPFPSALRKIIAFRGRPASLRSGRAQAHAGVRTALRLQERASLPALPRRPERTHLPEGRAPLVIPG